ncbi:hypothetical protein RI367_005215 [Sorochytrium milnesiophthora]
MPYVRSLWDAASNITTICSADEPDDTLRSLLINDMDSIKSLTVDLSKSYTFDEWLPQGMFLDSLERTGDPVISSATSGQQSQNTQELRGQTASFFKRGEDGMNGILPDAKAAVERDPSVLCYHQMKSLLFNQPEFVLKNLFIRGYYFMFQSATLAVFGVVYVVLSLATHHISMPTDMVIPTLIIGATFGRLYGVMVNEFKIILDQTMVDPGAYAVLGMAAFWSGTSRMVITVIVVAIEATYDQSYLLSLVIVALLAAGVGNVLGDSQFHMEIEHSGVPFLPFYPGLKMDEKKVADIMTPDPVVLAVDDSLECVVETIGSPALESPRASVKAHRYACADLHNGFPVVTSLQDKRLVGLILRRQLEEAQAKAQDPEMHAHWFNYADESPHSVQSTCAVSKAYRMFRSLGLRHLTVVNGDNRVIGILTRWNFAKEEAEEEGEHCVNSMTSNSPSSVTSTGTITETAVKEQEDTTLTQLPDEEDSTAHVEEASKDIEQQPAEVDLGKAGEGL